jgi:Na+/phosphate symporter
LRAALGKALGGRIGAFFAGLGVTALLQSSTATGLMAAGFAAEGLVSLSPALAAMLGANVGTTLIVQLLSFDMTCPVGSAGSPSEAVYFGAWLKYLKNSESGETTIGVPSFIEFS